MARPLVRFEHEAREFFLEWCTVWDAPRTFGLSEAELREHIREQYGREGLRELDERLVRCRETGTSAHGETRASILITNRAGPGERSLTEAGIIEWYCIRRVDPRRLPVDAVAPEHLWPREPEPEPETVPWTPGTDRCIEMLWPSFDERHGGGS